MQLTQTQQKSLQISLLLLRLGVFIVMFIWTVDKFINPAHSSAIFEKFYAIEGLNEIAVYIMGALQAILVLAFLAGIKKRISYGLIFLMHAGSTFSSFPKYLEPFDHLLFFAAWPMLAACFALYALRELDTMWTVK